MLLPQREGGRHDDDTPPLLLHQWGLTLWPRMRFVILTLLSFLAAHGFANTPGNSVACLGEILKYIVTSDRKLAEYQMTPNKFDMADTNQCYTIEFAPKRARPHHIKLVWQASEVSQPNRSDGDFWPNFMSNAVFRIVITNRGKERSQEIVVDKAPMTSVFYGERDLKPRSYESDVWRFHVSDFPWHYRDRINIEVKLLRAPCCSDYHVGSPRIIVTEWYPIY